VSDPQYRPLLVLIGLLYLGVTAATAIPWPNLTSSRLPSPRSWSDALHWTVASRWVVVLLAVISGFGVVSVRGNSIEPKLTHAARVYGFVMGAGLAATLVVIAAARVFLVGWATSGSGDDTTSTRGLGDSDRLWASIAISSVIAGVLGLVVFLTLLKWTNSRIKAADTLAFSPAYSTRYKHFLRFRIDREGDLTCYGIGIDPVGEGWFAAMTAADSTPSIVPPHDRAGIPRIFYIWGKTYRKFTPAPLEIAVSISDPQRDKEAPDWLVESFEHMSATLIQGGHVLMYGGTPGDGFTTRLHDIEQQVHAHNPNPRNRLVNYVPDYLWADDLDSSAMEVCRVRRTSNDAESEVDRRIRDLTAMRHHVTSRADVRIVIGGDLQPGSAQTRLAPGVLEEAYLSVAAGQPLIVLGGFAGAGRLIADALLGCANPIEIDGLAEHFVVPVAGADGVVPLGFVEMLGKMNSLGVLRNGLTDGENLSVGRYRIPNTPLEHRCASRNAQTSRRENAGRSSRIDRRLSSPELWVTIVPSLLGPAHEREGLDHPVLQREAAGSDGEDAEQHHHLHDMARVDRVVLRPHVARQEHEHHHERSADRCDPGTDTEHQCHAEQQQRHHESDIGEVDRVRCRRSHPLKQETGVAALGREVEIPEGRRAAIDHGGVAEEIDARCSGSLRAEPAAGGEAESEHLVEEGPEKGPAQQDAQHGPCPHPLRLAVRTQLRVDLLHRCGHQISNL